MNQCLGLVESVADFMSKVDEQWNRWTEELEFISDIWFRGHANSNWTLLPSVLRAPYNEVNEHRYRHEFQLRAQPFLHEATRLPEDDWDWYFLMQHYGIPTRLLDWTESALVALYFAVESRSEDVGRIWILQPRTINRYLSKVGDFVPIYSSELVSKYLPPLWDKKKASLAAGIAAIDPPFNSPRLAAQRGKFTVHGRNDKPIESYKSLAQSLCYLDIPPDAKSRIARQLLSAGKSHSVLFPSLHGLGQEIRDLYAIGHEI